ncbi:MobQ family relaxase [Rhodoblastus sp.]|uniref:MobQ family relaxase n=1 Tax=Rhodoblastus sp. TaxID=1962975 RepID=UPI003FD8E334
MAIFHLSVKAVSRKAGRSATAAAAYRAGEAIDCEREGRRHDYTRKQGVEHAEIIVPSEASWARDRSVLWNAAEAAEKRSNSTVAREYELALPTELPALARVGLAREFAQAVSDRYGVAADIAIHAPGREGDHRNWHAHVLTTTRVVTAEGLGAKTRQLDDQKTGPEQVKELRSLWAGMANQALERQGCSERISEKSHASRLEEAREVLAQAPERSEARDAALSAVVALEVLAEHPAPHLGPTVAAIERRAQRIVGAERFGYSPVTRIGEQWGQAERVRKAVEHYLGAARELSREIGAFAREKAEHGLEQAREAWGVVKDRLGLGSGVGAGSGPGPADRAQAEKREGVAPEGSFMERRQARQAEAAPTPSPERPERESAFMERYQAEQARGQGQGAERAAAPRTFEEFRGAGREPQRQEPEQAPAPARDDLQENDLQALADQKAAEALARYEERQARALSERADKLAEAALARLAEKEAERERQEQQEREERARQAAERQRGRGQGR